MHTNMIEGAWKHAKEHFRRMSGTKFSQFEGLLAEVMWRNRAKGKMYHRFFSHVKTIYNLAGPPVFSSLDLSRCLTPGTKSHKPQKRRKWFSPTQQTLNPKKRAARNQVTLSRPFCTAVLQPRWYNQQRRYNPQKPLKTALMILSSHRTILGSSLYLVHPKKHKT